MELECWTKQARSLLSWCFTMSWELKELACLGRRNIGWWMDVRIWHVDAASQTLTANVILNQLMSLKNDNADKNKSYYLWATLKQGKKEHEKKILSTDVCGCLEKVQKASQILSVLSFLSIHSCILLSYSMMIIIMYSVSQLCFYKRGNVFSFGTRIWNII